MLVQILNQLTDLWLGELTVGAYALALDSHLIIDEGREKVNWNTL